MVITQEVYDLVIHWSNKTTSFLKGTHYNEDIAQEVFENLIKYTDKVDCLGAFICTTVRNVSINRLRAAKRFHTYSMQYIDQMEKTTQPDTAKLVKDDYKKLLKVFKNHPAKHRILTILIENPDCSYVELAKTANINIDTFKANLLHIKKELRRLGLDKSAY